MLCCSPVVLLNLLGGGGLDTDGGSAVGSISTVGAAIATIATVATEAAATVAGTVATIATAATEAAATVAAATVATDAATIATGAAGVDSAVHAVTDLSVLVDVVGAASVANAGSVVVVVLVAHAADGSVDTVVAALIVLSLLSVLMPVMIGLVITELIESVHVVSIGITAGISIVISKFAQSVTEASDLVAAVASVTSVGTSGHVAIEMVKTDSTSISVLNLHGDVVEIDFFLASVTAIGETTVASLSADASIAVVTISVAVCAINSRKSIRTNAIDSIIEEAAIKVAISLLGSGSKVFVRASSEAKLSV